MRVFYQTYQYDPEHKLKFPPSEKKQCHSFVKAFLQLLYMLMSDDTQNIADITGTSRTLNTDDDAYTTASHPGLNSKTLLVPTAGSYSSGGGRTTNVHPFDIFSDDCGIVIGTSATAVAVLDDNLVAEIAHGSGAGQMIHYGCYGLNYTTGASSASFDLEKEFRNDSGGSITVQEIGIYVASSMGGITGSSARAFCIMRDVISPTVTVLNGEYLKVKYTIQVSV